MFTKNASVAMFVLFVISCSPEQDNLSQDTQSQNNVFFGYSLDGIDVSESSDGCFSDNGTPCEENPSFEFDMCHMTKVMDSIYVIKLIEEEVVLDGNTCTPPIYKNHFELKVELAYHVAGDSIGDIGDIIQLNNMMDHRSLAKVVKDSGDYALVSIFNADGNLFTAAAIKVYIYSASDFSLGQDEPDTNTNIPLYEEVNIPNNLFDLSLDSVRFVNNFSELCPGDGAIDRNIEIYSNLAIGDANSCTDSN